MLRPLYIIGTGGFAKEVAQLAARINHETPRWNRLCYLSADPGARTAMPYGAIAGGDEVLNAATDPCEVVIGIGQPRLRRKLAHWLAGLDHVSCPNLIHPMCDIDTETVQIGTGNIVTRGTAITCDIEIGNHNVFNLNTTVGHDCRIGSFNVINPGANISGGTQVGDACLIGTGAQLLENVQVASDSVIGAGAVVTRSLQEPGIYVGMPARRQ